jgi:protease-4
MRLVRGAWKLLVGIKDALVLALMLLFFGALFAALNARSRAPAIKDGALVLDLNGPIVEQPEEVTFTQMLSGQQVGRQYRLRDIVRALDAAKSDDRVKAVVVNLERFGGAYPAALGEVAAKLAEVRRAGKPVLAYAIAYTDGGYRLAASASEIWMDPQGGTLFAGPGGTQMYYKGLIDKLGVNAHVYRVGKFKSAVEPYIRADQSPEARAASEALYGGLFEQWRSAVQQARPKAQVAALLANPAQTVQAAGGDVAQANLRGGIVDHLGDKVAFGRRVAQIVGGDDKKPAGYFTKIDYDAYVDAKPLPKTGKIGIVTVAGNIVDGKASGGTAGGDTISDAIYKGLAKNDLKAIVLRVDSPGGSVLASEKIRVALLEAKRRGLPIVVSMGGLAASGGYWVSTPGDVIFAEPDTITGSIGIFGVIPTFENTLAKVGITSDGVRTTPLSGQPDVFGGTNPVIDTVIQSTIEHGYMQFLTRVSQSRHLPIARVNEIGQGRVWLGGPARQLGLVDRFGDLSDAVAEAAKRAKVEASDIVYLEKQPGFTAEIARQWRGNDDDDDDAGMGALASGDLMSRMAWQQRQLAALAIGDAKRMLSGASVRAECLQCAGAGPVVARAGDLRLLDLLLAKVGL